MEGNGNRVRVDGVGRTGARISGWPATCLLWCVALAALPVFASSASAQEFERSGLREGRLEAPLREGLPEFRKGFMFCRLFYTAIRREPSGLGWSTDYPRGDENFMVRLSQLTTTHVSKWADDAPGHAVVRGSDPDLFKCPFLFASDIGTAAFNTAEVEGLRTYFAKGGMLWVDDFWGERAWAQWVEEIGRILPGHSIVDIPLNHPLFSVVYVVDHVPQIPNIGFWQRSGGATSERGAETENATMRGIFDGSGRLLVLMTHNTDIADAWEREGESDDFFRLFSPVAYGIAVNVAVWVMTR